MAIASAACGAASRESDTMESDTAVTNGALPLALPPTGTAMLVGDSGLSSATPAFVAALHAAGWNVVPKAFSGVGLTTVPGVLKDWEQTVRQEHVDLTIVAIGVWDRHWLDAHGDAAYSRLIDGAIAALTAVGGKVLWLSLLPGDRFGNRAAFDPMFRELPRRYPGTVAYVDIEPALRGPHGGYPRVAGPLVLRGRDGWHLCQDGSAAVAHMALRSIGLDRGEWDRGTWRLSPSYDIDGPACRR